MVEKSSMSRNQSDIESDIDYVKKQIDDLEYDSSGIRLRLDDDVRLAKEAHTRNYTDWREKKRRLHEEAHELENKINYYERLKIQNESSIRDYENRIAECQRESYQSRRSNNDLQNDDIDDRFQSRDIDNNNSSSNYSLQKIDEYEREISRLQNERDRNEHEWYEKQSDLSGLSGKTVDGRREYLDNKQQIDNIYNDKARTDKGNLNDNLARRRNLEAELKRLYEELNTCHLEAGDKNHHNSYQATDYNEYNRYLKDSWSEDPDENEDDGYVPGPPPAYNHPAQKNRLAEIKMVAVTDSFSSRRRVLQKYALQTRNDYVEYKSIQGFRARVGKVHYYYRDDKNLTVFKQGGVPSIEDFMVIFAEEKRLGRNALPLGNIQSPEYRARMVVAAKKAGIKAMGQVRLTPQEVAALSPEVRVPYKLILQQIEAVNAAVNARIKPTSTPPASNLPPAGHNSRD